MRGESADTDGFFLDGRSFIWQPIGFSLFATNLSGAPFVGLAGAGYNSGISVFSYEGEAADHRDREPHRNTVERILLGTDVESVVRHAPCPVLVAHEGMTA